MTRSRDRGRILEDRSGVARLREIFDAVVDEDRASRKARLARLCAGHPALRREVEGLLARVDARPTSPADPEEFDPLGADPEAPPPAIHGFAPLRRIGRGGMGEVFATHRLVDRRPVAIKWPFQSVREEPRRLRRFRREGALLARLDHPRIVRLLGQGWHEGTPYLVLSLVETGVPIDRFVRERGIDLGGVIGLAREIALALAHAHERGLVHRDLKASNVLVDAEGRPTLLDFGIAKVAHEDLAASLAYTTAEELLGSLEAMSPEQTRLVEAPVDGRSDVYQLALLLRDLVAPRSAATVEPIGAAARLRAITRRARIGSIEGDRRLASDLRRVLRAALRRHPDDRHPTVGDFAGDLDSVLEGCLRRPTAPGLLRRAMASSGRVLHRIRRRAS